MESPRTTASLWVSFSPAWIFEPLLFFLNGEMRHEETREMSVDEKTVQTDKQDKERRSGDAEVGRGRMACTLQQNCDDRRSCLYAMSV